MEFTLLLIPLLFIGLLQAVIPFLVKRTVVFGVTIPYEQTQHPQVRAFKRIYASITAAVAVVVLAGYVIWNQGSNEEAQLVLSGIILPLMILLTSLALYFYFHYKMVKLKASEQWFKGTKQVRIADFTARSQDEVLPSFVHLIPATITITIMVITVTAYDQLPSQIPIHWGPDGQADAFTEKSWSSVFNLPLILLLLQLMFFGINMATKKSGIKINAGNVPSTKLRQLRLRKYTSWFLLVVNMLITGLFSLLQLNLLYEDLFGDAMLMLLPIVFLILILGGAFILAMRVGSVDSDLEGKHIVGDSSKVEGIDEDQYWKGGVIYFNPNDPSIFVEKRFGIGFTLNFANPIGYFLFLVPLAIILVLSFSL